MALPISALCALQDVASKVTTHRSQLETYLDVPTGLCWGSQLGSDCPLAGRYLSGGPSGTHKGKSRAFLGELCAGAFPDVPARACLVGCYTPRRSRRQDGGRRRLVGEEARAGSTWA